MSAEEFDPSRASEISDASFGGSNGLEDDAAEAVDPLKIENTVPAGGYQRLPMVGLGGSAGSITALQTFFERMPAESGIVFVVVIHLSPEHKSELPSVLQRCTSMKVHTASDGVKVEPNNVYVIPPGKCLTAVDGHLGISDLETERGKRTAVDHFYRTLADTHGPHSVAITLSGADGDGAIGIKRIKERGGLTIAQDPDEAEYTGMPRSAIATAMVDWVLPVAEMPDRLLQYVQLEKHLKLPSEDGPQPSLAQRLPTADAEGALRDVLTYLRTRTGRDFSYYKRATIVRRISRRMQVNGLDEVPQYLAYLRTHQGEAGALLQDLLISVTNFFRDSDCFESLEAMIPRLFEGKGPDDSVRVWVAACATGEEAYSVAMLLCEYARTLDAPPVIQVFATDLDDEVVQSARDGVYPDTISADVSEERLRRFFIKDHRGYRVRREIREMVLFALHDVLKDSPFSRLDLVTCRNLLIYLNREAQSRVMEIFHFGLVPGGRLFLGSSESVDDGSLLFEVLDKKHRIYMRRASSRVGLPVPSGPSTLARALEQREVANDRPSIPGSHGHPHETKVSSLRRHEVPGQQSATWSELHYRMLERFAPPSVLVNKEHDIVHSSETAHRFLQYAGGEPTRNLLRCVHPMLRLDLRAALYRAAQTGLKADALGIALDLEGHKRLVTMSVTVANDISPEFLLVAFLLHDVEESAKLDGLSHVEPDPVARQLERELETMKSHLRDVVEQYEASTEELKASNEELQAMNEELRSASEELETSREELQSINEELTTVNQELKCKVDEVGHTNSDLRNLIGATEIATVFLDRDLRITRYTPMAVSLFKLIPTDLGRPLTDLKHRLDYAELETDAAQVLETLASTEREVRDAKGSWFIARVIPYRTVEDRIAGLVLTLVNITERKRAEEQLRASEERLRLVIESAREYAIFTMDLDRRVTSWNSGAERMLGYTEVEIMGKSGDIIFTEEDRAAAIPELEIRGAVTDGRSSDERWHLRKDGSQFWASGVMMAMHNQAKLPVGFVKIFRDQTEARATQQALEESRREAEAANKAKDHFLAILSHELRTPLTPIAMAAQTIADEPGLSETALDSIEMIQRNVRLETSLINDLLDVTRIARGKMEITRAPMELHNAIREAVEVCKENFKGKKQRLSIKLEARKSGISGDYTRLQQVFWNLLQNASKFTPERGAVSLHTFVEGDRILAEITDSGIGIAPECLTSIFDAFNQGDESITRRYGGLGLGLAISRATVQAHGGLLTVRSLGAGKGATFCMELPLA